MEKVYLMNLYFSWALSSVFLPTLFLSTIKTKPEIHPPGKMAIAVSFSSTGLELLNLLEYCQLPDASKNAVSILPESF